MHDSPAHTQDAAKAPGAAPRTGAASRVRLRGAAVAAACLVLLAAARLLRPSPAGCGTHQQLGLPACGWVVKYGWPCPTCGLTTSFVAAAHGRFGEAAIAQPFGLAAFVAVVALGAAGALELARGRGVLGRLRPRWWWACVAVGGLLVGWGVKLAVGVATGRLPIR